MWPARRAAGQRGPWRVVTGQHAADRPLAVGARLCAPPWRPTGDPAEQPGWSQSFIGRATVPLQYEVLISYVCLRESSVIGSVPVPPPWMRGFHWLAPSAQAQVCHFFGSQHQDQGPAAEDAQKGIQPVTSFVIPSLCPLPGDRVICALSF